MPVFQPILSSQPTAVGPSRPVQNTGMDALARGVGNALTVGAQAFSDLNQDPKELKQWQIEMQATEQFQKDLRNAQQLAPEKREDAVNAAVLNLSRFRDTSTPAVADIMERFGFSHQTGVSEEVRLQNQMEERSDYGIHFAAAINRGMSEDEARDYAYSKTYTNMFVEAAVREGAANANIAASHFQTKVADLSNDILDMTSAFVSNAAIPPAAIFEGLDRWRVKLGQEALEAMVNADSEARSKVKASLSELDYMIESFKTRWSPDEMKQRNLQKQLRGVKAAFDAGIEGVTPEAVAAAETLLLQGDPRTWENLFIINDDIRTAMLRGMTWAFRQENLPVSDDVSSNVEPIRRAKVEADTLTEDGDIGPLVGVSRGITKLFSGDPNSMRDPAVRNASSNAIALISAFIGKAGQDGKIINKALMDEIFSPKMASYFNGIAQNDPTLAAELYNDLQVNINTYRQKVNQQVQQAENRGWRFDVDTGEIDFDLAVYMEDNQFTDEEKILMTGIFEETYGGDTRAFVMDRGARLSDQVPFGASRGAGNTDPATRQVISKFRNGIQEARSFQRAEEWGDMVRSVSALNKTFNTFRNDNPPFQKARREEVERYAPVVDLIDITETGVTTPDEKRYSTLWGHTNNSIFKDKEITKMSVNQLIDFTKKGGKYSTYTKTWYQENEPDHDAAKYGTTPLGRWQIVGSNLPGLKETLGLTGNELFTPDLQDKMFVALAEERLQGVTTVEGKMKALRGLWEGLQKVKDEDLRAVVELL